MNLTKKQKIYLKRMNGKRKNIKFNGRDYLLACEDGQEEEFRKINKSTE